MSTTTVQAVTPRDAAARTYQKWLVLYGDRAPELASIAEEKIAAIKDGWPIDGDEEAWTACDHCGAPNVTVAQFEHHSAPATPLVDVCRDCLVVALAAVDGAA